MSKETQEDDEYMSCDIEYEECVQEGKVLLKCTVCKSMFEEPDKLIEHFTSAHLNEKYEKLERQNSDVKKENSNNLGDDNSGANSTLELNKRGVPARKRKLKTFEIDDVISIPVKKLETVQHPAPNVSMPATSLSTSQELPEISVKICSIWFYIRQLALGTKS